MAEFLEDPSVLTKDKLKNELAANNVPLPSGEHKKEVYVQLYLKHLTVLNSNKSPPADTFSSDEELPAPVVSNRSRSGRKATRKTDKPRAEEVEVTDLTDEDLKQQLAKHGVDTGPIVASTRKVYEKKLQKLLDEPAAEPDAPMDVTTLPKVDSNQNGNTNSDLYSDKEDEEIAAPEPEPVPVVEKSVRSRGKTPVTVRTSSRRQTKVVEEFVIEETPKKASKSVVEDILANEINTPTGMRCQCGHCGPMDQVIQSVCCQDLEPFKQLLQSLNPPAPHILCVTGHPGFAGCCLNPYVLRLAYHTFREQHGPIRLQLNEQFRYIAKRQMIRWSHGIIGRHIRKPLPSCVVNAIRAAFPDGAGHYNGFQWPSLD